MCVEESRVNVQLSLCELDHTSRDNTSGWGHESDCVCVFVFEGGAFVL